MSENAKGSERPRGRRDDERPDRAAPPPPPRPQPEPEEVPELLGDRSDYPIPRGE